MIHMILAQTDPLNNIIDVLLNNGIMGVIAGGLFWLYTKRDSQLQDCQNGRLEDAKSLAVLIKDHAVALQTQNEAFKERARVVDASVKAAEKSALVIEQLNKEISDLKNKMGK